MSSDMNDILWRASCREDARAPELTTEVDVDLAIIGGGYTGLSAALHAAQAGAKVCVVEAQEFGHGGSGRNVGLANAGLWLPPEDIEAQLGVEAGRRLSDLLAGAPDMVFNLIAEHGIDCEPVRAGTLHCAHAPGGVKDLRKRHAQLAERGAPVTLLSRDEAVARVGSDQVHGALFDPRAGTIQPLAYAKGLARAAQGAGAQLYERSLAQSVTRDGAGWRIETPSGRITAGKLLLATNAYATRIPGLDNPSVIPVHYFQAATEPLSPALRDRILASGEGCWDTALIMSSWRMDQAGRLVIGGMGQLNHPGGAIHRSWLRRKLAKMFPALAETPFEHEWFGRIAMTSEHMPKLLSVGDSGMICFGYSGRGIGPGTLFGQRIAEALLSGDNSGLPVAPTLSHSLPFAGGRQGYYETGATLMHLVMDRG